MRRTGWLVLAVCLCAGCGGGKPGHSALSFEQLPDSAGLTRGKALVTAFEPSRMKNGVVRVRGTVEFPDGTRLQVSIYRKKTHEMVARVQVTIANSRFDSPPILGQRGPLPVEDYAFEVLTYFNDSWQPAQVLNASHDGLGLRGPGVTRDRLGHAAFLLTREARL